MALSEKERIEIIELDNSGLSSRKISKKLGIPKSTIGDFLRKETYKLWWSERGEVVSEPDRKHLPKVLILDIETAPTRGFFWGLWNQNMGLNMITNEWFILSYSAKWLGEPEEEIIYDDLRGQVAKEDDRKLLKGLWNLLDECDIVITQNGKKFDIKKINARFVMNDFLPPSSYKHIDTLQIAKSEFAFTSNKLEWMTHKLNVKFKKLDHGRYFGFNLWNGMMNDELGAWEECEDYNKHDVLSLEELYIKLAAWDKKHPNFSLYFDEPKQLCRCGSSEFVEDGYAYTQLSKFQRYRCVKCGAESRSRKNLFTKEKRESLRLNVLN